MPSKEYREKNLEKIKQWEKKYRETHKKEKAEYMKKYRERNKDILKEKKAEYMKKYREKNKDILKEKADKYWRERAIIWLKEQGVAIHENSIKRAKSYLQIRNREEQIKNDLARKWDRKLNDIVENIEGGDLDEE